MLAVFLTFLVQGLLFTIYTSKLASFYHSELGHDVYSANSHHGEATHHNEPYNSHYAPVSNQIPQGYVNSLNQIDQAPIAINMPVT